MEVIAEKVNAANSVDELFEISGRYCQMFGSESKKYYDVVTLCLNRFEQIYGISFIEYCERGKKLSELKAIDEEKSHEALY